MRWQRIFARQLYTAEREKMKKDGIHLKLTYNLKEVYSSSKANDINGNTEDIFL